MVDPKTAIQKIAQGAQTLSAMRVALEVRDTRHMDVVHAYLHKQFYSSWLEIIAGAASKGMGGCTLPFEHLILHANSLDFAVNEFVNAVNVFFQDTDFRIMGFGGWKYAYVLDVKRDLERPPKVIQYLHGLLYISWRNEDSE